MFNIFNSRVFVEIGEAIGNVGRRLFAGGSNAESLDEAFKRALQDPLPMHLQPPDKTASPERPNEFVIESNFRVLDPEEES